MGAVERLRCIWRDETAGRMQVTISKKNQAEMNRPQVGKRLPDGERIWRCGGENA
jgi:hypothetical protein